MGARVRSKREFSREDYFDFLYFLAFKKRGYRGLAKFLFEYPFKWYLLLDENRVYDGIEIRKYYLCDELGYLPDDIDVDNVEIFTPQISVLEVLVGFANRINRDLIRGKRVADLVWMFVNNLGLVEIWDDFEKNPLHSPYEKGGKILENWMSGIDFGLFDIEKSHLSRPLWEQVMVWIDKNR